MLFGKYKFICQLENDAILPFFKGSTFRGFFGIALKRVVCALKRQECKDCILKQRCIYALVFETPLALDMPEGSRISSPPHPFVIEPPLTDRTEFEKDSLFDCDLILFGEANNSLPYFVYAFDQMGKIGIGKRISGKRGQFKLKEVRNGDKKIYSDTDQKLNQFDAVEALTMHEPDARTSGAPKNSNHRIRVTLETPLRIKFENRLKADLPFHVLVRAMLRRVSSLFNVYGNGEPPIDYTGMVRRAEEVQIVDSRLSWFDWRRFSNRQNRKMLMGGMTGEAMYGGEIDKFIPLIDVCLKVHIGKQTSFGLGKINAELI